MIKRDINIPNWMDFLLHIKDNVNKNTITAQTYGTTITPTTGSLYIKQLVNCDILQLNEHNKDNRRAKSIKITKKGEELIECIYTLMHYINYAPKSNIKRDD